MVIWPVLPSHVTQDASAQVEVLSCFRPGDIVRAEVLSVGDARSYYLTTAKNELGVVFAKSLAGLIHTRHHTLSLLRPSRSLD